MRAAAQPEGRLAMRHVWRDLLFLHWQVDAVRLRRLIPRELDLDLFDGKAYVGLIPFWMPNIHVASPIAVPIAETVFEVNVRTYVHRKGREPGVWFFSLDASSLPAVVAARIGYKLPYHWSKMKVDRGERGCVRYCSRRLLSPAVGCRVEYERGGVPSPAEPGTLAHFLVERYILYAGHRGAIYRANVRHEPYPLQNAKLGSVQENLIAAAGIERPSAEPIVHFVRHVNVDVFALRRAPQ